jgi:hypothetical protein
MLNSEQRTKLLQEIEVYKIKTKIEGDPSETGLSFNYALLAALSEYITRTGSIVVEAIGHVAEVERILKDLNHSYNVKKMIESNKNEIKILKSADLRNSAVDLLLSRDLELIKNEEKDYIDAKAFLDQTKLGHSDLKLKREVIDSQMDILGHMRGIGEIRRPPQLQEKGARLV